MTYNITPEQVNEFTEAKKIFGSTKYLPANDDIPEAFKSFLGSGEARPYVQMVNSMFFGDKMPEYEMSINDGFSKEQVIKCIRAHLTSWEPKHEHKIAGVAYMLSKMTTVIKVT